MGFTRKLVGYLVAAIYRVMKPGAFHQWVVFHHLPPAEFEKIIAWYHKRGLDKELVITFDDGWKEVAEYAKTLERYNLTAKLFIAPHETERGNVWTEECERLGMEGWRRLYKVAASEREEIIDSHVEVERGRSLLSKQELLELGDCIEIENHTMTHLSATDRPVEEVVAEVKEAQDILESWTGRRPKYIAWPFGRGSEELDKRVRGMGLEPVYTNIGKPNGRTMAIEGATILENIGRLTGAWPKVGVTR